MSAHTTTALTHPLCLYALKLFSHTHYVRMQRSCCHSRCVCADHICSDTNVEPSYVPPFSEQRMMICHVRCDKPRSSTGDTKCDADSLHEPSRLALLLRGHPLLEPHISLPRESLSAFRGDQLVSSSNHAEPLPIHVSRTDSVTNSHKETSKYAEAPLCCTTPSCSHNVVHSQTVLN